MGQVGSKPGTGTQVQEHLMNRSLVLRSLSLGCLLLLVAGCGFALRGLTPLPVALQTLELESVQADSDFEREVRRTLRNNGVTLVEADSRYRLVLGAESVSERTLSVNSNARAGEYELNVRVSFHLSEAGSLVSGPHELATSRVYLTDPENAVAKEEEAELIRAEMRRELAQQLLRQLQGVELPGNP